MPIFLGSFITAVGLLDAGNFTVELEGIFHQNRHKFIEILYLLICGTPTTTALLDIIHIQSSQLEVIIIILVISAKK